MTTVLTDQQRAVLGLVLDRLIPAGLDMPGAGEVGVTEYVESLCKASAEVAQAVAKLIEQADDVANADHSQAFDSLSTGQRDEVLRQLESADPDSFGELVRHTYSGYYTDPTVVGLLGADAGPPQPGGFPIKPFDPAIVDRVRKLGPLYRQV